MRRAVAFLACAGAALAFGLGRGSATQDGRLAGDPAAGALVFTESRCGFCHTFSAAGSRGPSAPDLDWSPRADAPRARLPIGGFVLSRIVWGGRGMPAFGTTLDAAQVDDLVSFVIGKPFTAPAGSAPAAPSFRTAPVPSAQAALVRRWLRVARLPATVAPGAKLFAKVACLACHTYLGSGTRSLGGRDLTSIGNTRTAGYLTSYLRNPARFGNRRMPSFAALARADLARLVAFLAASRGR